MQWQNAVFVASWLVLLVLDNICNGQQQVACTQTGACSCKTPTGDVIDLSPLDSQNPNKARFSDYTTTLGGAKYSYNPCSGFSEKACKQVAVCQIESETHQYSTGIQSTATFANDKVKGLVLQYDDGQAQGQRRSDVQLLCDRNKDAVFVAVGEQDPGSGVYEFTLTSKYACPQAKPLPGSAGGGLSVGSILCILAVVFIIVYITGGVLFLHFARGAGGTDMIPNVTFWSQIPALVKEGTLFTFRGCKPPATYAEL